MQVLRVASCSDRYLQQLFLNVCLKRSHTCKRCVLCTKQCGLHSELICTEMVFRGLISYSVLGSSVINRDDPCRTREAHTHTHPAVHILLLCASLSPCLAQFCWCPCTSLAQVLVMPSEALSVTFYCIPVADEKVVIKENMMEKKGIAGAG